MKIVNCSGLKFFKEERPCVNDSYTYAERKQNACRETNDTIKSVKYEIN